MNHRLSRRVGATALLATAGLLGALLIAPAAPAATINACQKKKGGTIRIVSSKTKCKKTEKKVSWSTTGANGTNGANGANGTNGSSGTNGTNGTNGAQGIAGQPQTAFTFTGASDSGFPTAIFTPLVTVGDVSLRMNCGFFLANAVGLQASGPAGTTSRTAMIVTRSNGSDAPGVAQTLLQSDNVTTNTSIASLTTNTSGDLTNLGQVSGVLTSPTQVVWFEARLTAAPSPAACAVTGTAFSISR